MSKAKYQILTSFYFLITLLKTLRYQIFYFVKHRISIYGLKCINKVDFSTCNDEIRLFAIMRNEALRLPYFIKYYKMLGVHRLFLIDNGSTDESVNLALKERCVHVFHTKDNYKNHWHWMQYLLDTYGKGHWCIVVDIDELFSYPHSDWVSLPALCTFLEKDKKTSIRSLLLDMYPSNEISSTNYKQGTNPLEVVNFFDKSYEVVPFTFPDKFNSPFIFNIFTGGVRDRVFGKSSPPSILSKVSLFKYDSLTYLSQGMHAINKASLSELQGVVFHTKFLSDFLHEVKEECQREQHYGNAFYYKQFKKVIEEKPSLSFHCADSVKYRDIHQLVELGLMKTTPEFEEYALGFSNHPL